MPWLCPYCGWPLANEQAACCGEIGHAEWMEDDDYEAFADIVADDAGIPRAGPI